MSLTSKEVIAGKFRKRTWEERDGTYVLEEHHVRDDWSWMENRWIVVTDGDVREFTVSPASTRPTSSGGCWSGWASPK